MNCFITWCQTTKVVQTPLLVSAHAWSVSDTNSLKGIFQLRINYLSCFITWCQITKVVQIPLPVSAHA